jgi:tetratricopeptide (TPR) repeat protein
MFREMTRCAAPVNPPGGGGTVDSRSAEASNSVMLANPPSQGAPSAKSKVALQFASAALRSGDRLKAQMLLRDRLIEDPMDADAMSVLAHIAVEDRQIEEATVLLRRALSADPKPERRLVLIEHLQKHAGPALALREFEQLPDDFRSQFEVSGMEAKTLGLLGMHDQQISTYQRMVRERPNRAGTWMNLANALRTVGRTDEAVKALKRATKLEPTMGQAYWTLANFKSYRFTTPDIAQMQNALRQKVSVDEALHIHFALGKAFEDQSNWEASFKHYSAGNALRTRQLDPETIPITEPVEEALAYCRPDVFERFKGAGCTASDPVFVFGLHRSGSTLIEQILASHPQIEGTSELTVMNTIAARFRRSSGQKMSELLETLNPADIKAIGEEYIERTRPFRHTDKPYFVDKMPGNWINATLIRLALPKAKMIDARRSPMACGFSNFKQNYASGVTFSYSLRSIGEFYYDYWRFMRHFDSVQSGTVHRVLNERLIEDPEGEVRRVLDYIGVPFAESCLEFHANTRAVRTPSAEQVRRPINRDGVDYWRHYEPWLDELKDALGPALEGWDQ